MLTRDPTGPHSVPGADAAGTSRRSSAGRPVPLSSAGRPVPRSSAGQPVPGPTQGLRSRWGAGVLCAVAVAGALIFVAWAKMETVQITYRIDALMDRDQELAEEQRRLRSELAELRSPRRLQALAPELGLATPEPGHVIVVTGDPEGLAAILADEEAPNPLEDTPATEGETP